jgi:CRISPR-associated protein Cas1
MDLIKAKLEPYLGFLHSVQYGKPSLVCDFMEIYRYLIDNFLIEYCRNLSSKDFTIKTENLGRTKQGKRQYLTNQKTRDLLKKLEVYFESMFDVPRIKFGKKQTFETLIIEEALLLARYMRNEKSRWVPRIFYNSLQYSSK